MDGARRGRVRSRACVVGVDADCAGYGRADLGEGRGAGVCHSWDGVRCSAWKRRRRRWVVVQLHIHHVPHVISTRPRRSCVSMSMSMSLPLSLSLTHRIRPPHRPRLRARLRSRPRPHMNVRMRMRIVLHMTLRMRPPRTRPRTTRPRAQILPRARPRARRHRYRRRTRTRFIVHLRRTEMCCASVTRGGVDD